jgi:mannose-1-phosphate guanylyltransferase/mannose-1-phosphate guanylyltransferase/mannose-6-phosphate isomerase
VVVADEGLTVAAQRIQPVILSGGSGTRLWPLSTPERPKQFLELFGNSTMLQMTAARVADADRFEPPLVVASPDHADLIEELLRDQSTATLILEPTPRNTAPAIALAALTAPAGELLLVMPSDHLIGQGDRFRAAVSAAAERAAEGWLVTFGIKPSRADTGYGYIRRGEALAPGIFQGRQFVEKPDQATAGRYLSDGNYDWNAGIFLFRADAYLNALAEHAPDVLAAAQAALDGATRKGRRVYPDLACFARSPSISIDYAVMERVARFAVVPLELEWSDVGSWAALHEASVQDGSGNTVGGNVLALGAHRSLLRSTGPKLVAIGVEDLVVIATDDAVLVVPMAQSQRVKEAVDALRSAGGTEKLGG